MVRQLALLCAMLMALPAIAGKDADHYSAMTYNIRLDLASDDANSWPHRRSALTSLIAYYAPDIIGLQEVLLHQKQGIDADLLEYRFVGVARDDGKEAGEFSPVGYRYDRFHLRDSGTFWLSPTPDTPGKGWDAAYPRIASWARLKDRKSKRELLVVNTHFDHVGEVARLESARQIRRWIAEHRKRNDAVILLGDFNAPTESPAYRAIVDITGDGTALYDASGMSDSPHFGPRGTFNAFKIEQVPDWPIDHIFVGDDVKVLRHATLTQQYGGRLPSDHYPVLADLCIGKRC